MSHVSWAVKVNYDNFAIIRPVMCTRELSLITRCNLYRLHGVYKIYDITNLGGRNYSLVPRERAYRMVPCFRGGVTLEVLYTVRQFSNCVTSVNTPPVMMVLVHNYERLCTLMVLLELVYTYTNTNLEVMQVTQVCGWSVCCIIQYNLLCYQNNW